MTTDKGQSQPERRGKRSEQKQKDCTTVFSRDKNRYSRGDLENSGEANLCSCESGWEGGAHEALGTLAVPDDSHMRGPQETK